MTEHHITTDGVHSWELREWDWCVLCFGRACDEGMAVCHMCAADNLNP